jgi:DNA-binding winged helix-turn-helix (wHTH) protein
VSVTLPSSQQHIIRFDDFEADLRSRQLRKAGRLIDLQDMPFRILVILLEHAGDVITREELKEKLWHGETSGDFDQRLNSAVGKLREALADHPDKPRFVETLPRRGYRFIGPVQNGAPAVTPIEQHREPRAETVAAIDRLLRTAIESINAALGRLKSFRVQPIVVVTGVVIVLLLASLGFRFWNFWLPSRPDVAAAERTKNSLPSLKIDGNGKEVSPNNTVCLSETRDTPKFYVVVEPATIADRWNQGRVTSRGCLNARFGDSNTSSGTEFRVYVLATNEEIPVGLMSAPPKDAEFSPPITVKLKR